MTDPRFDRANPSRISSFFLGGADCYGPDVEVAAAVLEQFPHAYIAARSNRTFGLALTRHLALAGITQFLDVGIGYPDNTGPNLHEVAQAVAPQARVVYVDCDPIVLCYARALMASTPQGRVTVLEADVRDPHAILASPTLGETLDLQQPIALSMNALLHFIADHDNPHSIVATLMNALAPGSYLVMTHLTDTFSDAVTGAVAAYRSFGLDLVARNTEQFAAFFAGLHQHGPGVAALTDWLAALGTCCLAPADAAPPQIGLPLTRSHLPMLAAVGHVGDCATGTDGEWW